MRVERKIKGDNVWLQYVALVLFFFFSIVAVSVYFFNSFLNLANEEITRSGMAAAEKDAEIVNNILDDGKSSLLLVQRLTERILKDDMPLSEVEALFVTESERYKTQRESEYFGIYGYVNGTYIDGDHKNPSKDFKAQDTPWFKSAVRARTDEPQIIAFGDASDGQRVVAICKAFNNKQDVVSLSIPLKRIRSYSKSLSNAEKKWLLMDLAGNIIDHHVDLEVGQNYLSDAYWGTEKENLARKVTRARSGMVNVIYEGKESYAFVAPLENEWLLVSFLDKASATESVRWLMVRNVMVVVSLLLIVVVICGLTFLRHRKISKIIKAKRVIQKKMNHEMLASINGILGMNSVVMKSIRDESTRVFSESIGSAMQDLHALISDANDFSFIERGNSKSVSEGYELFTLISDCYNNVMLKAKLKNLQVSLECDPELPSSLWGDVKRLRQTLYNLLTDAVKRTESGGILISVGFDKSPKVLGASDSSIVLKIAIRDTGESLNFDQLVDDNWDNASAELCIAKMLLTACGGDLVVKSRYGESTTFMVSLPQVVLNVEPMGDFFVRYNVSLIEKETFDTLFAPSARILVVDDVDINLKVVAGLLKTSKIQVDMAVSATQCLELVAIRHYDLILLDYSLPVMDGIKTFERMKKIENSPNKDTPVIIATAKTIEFSDSYLKLGLTDFIVKPYQEQDLMRILAWYLPKNLILTGDDLLEFPQRKNSGKSSTKKSQERFENETEELEFHSVLTPEEKLFVFDDVLNVKMGLEYFSHDVRCYCEVLQEFVRDNKAENFKKLYAAEDWENYLVLIHSTRNVAYAIGADDLSRMAQSIESACKDLKYDEVANLHAGFVNLYEENVEKIKKGLSEYES
ncbi:MAG: response regulator [Fibrobacter sp.]|nr:response regulator [Fibrobacter sp.]